MPCCISEFKVWSLIDPLMWDLWCAVAINIKIKTVAPFNHKSLQAEHGIKSLSTILTKHLTEQGQMWPKYLPLATLAHNNIQFSKFS